MLQAAFEKDHKQDTSDVRDGHIMAAAKWIIWFGHCLFKHVVYSGDDMSPKAPKEWKPASAYDADHKLVLCPSRW